MDLLKEGLEKLEISKFTMDYFGRNLVSQCCIYGNLSMLQYLVSIWGDECLDIEDIFSCTLTHLASRGGHLSILKYLQSKNKLSNSKESRFQATALDLCIALNHVDCIEFLIQFADQDSLNSALLNASNEGKTELVEKLLDHGAQVETRMPDTGATPLDRAAYNGHLSTVKLLVEKGKSIIDNERPNGTTALFHASFHGHAHVVRYLLEQGANPNKKRKTDQTTPLFMACKLVLILL